MMLFPSKKIISGCAARGDAESAYLTRWTLFKSERRKVYLHAFHRSDHDVLHDHPWAFWTLILWRGYMEEYTVPSDGPITRVKTRRIWPGQILFRPATHTHRVRLHRDTQGNERTAVTLVMTGPYIRDWGFHGVGGWVLWREYFTRNGC